MWKYTSVRTPMHWWQLCALGCSIRKTLLLLLNSLLYTNLGSGSNPGLSNKISGPELIFLNFQIALGVLSCPIQCYIQLWIKSKICFAPPPDHCAMWLGRYTLRERLRNAVLSELPEPTSFNHGLLLQFSLPFVNILMRSWHIQPKLRILTKN